ncbi:MAG: T9SS type A sorting domain-containing protein [Ginsengibacter sp.]
MKKIFTLLSSILFFCSVTKAQDILNITNFSMGEPYSDVFTTNYFKCIGIGKNGWAWAGTRYGGLYRYDLRSTDPFNGWVKSDQLTNVYINDIKADKNGGIWIAQSGTQGQTSTAAHIAGGLNYFPNPYDYGMEFFSQAGTQTDGYLYSRNVKSLFISPDFDNKVWAIQGGSTSASKAIRGGLNRGPNDEGRFQRIAGLTSGWDYGWGVTPTGESIGGSNSEIWAGVRLNHGKFQIIRYYPDGRNIVDGILDNTTDPALLTGYTPTVIYFDKAGNKWIGLKNGGILVKKFGGKGEWVTMKDIDLVSGGFMVNPNAITEDQYGSIYFGTSSGLLVYSSKLYNVNQDPATTSSYKFYTTDNGLSNNNITGVTYDNGSGKLLMTSDAGVSFFQVRPQFIKGAVYDVYTGITKETATTPGLKMIPEQTATIRLYLAGEEKESTHADATGIFELKKAENDKEYTVEVEYTNKEYRKMKYIYNGIKNHTLLLPTLLPDSLIKEINSFKADMAKRCFEFKPLSLPIPITTCYEGFYTVGYDEPGNVFFKTTGIDKDHYKKVENLAIYFMNMKAVYFLGGNAHELITEMFDNVWSLIGILGGNNKLGEKTDEKLPIQVDVKIKEKMVKYQVGYLKYLREGLLSCLKLVSAALPPPRDASDKLKQTFDDAVAVFSDASEVIINLADKRAESGDDGLKGGLKDAFIAQLTKFASVQFGAVFYQKIYAQSIHEKLVRDAADGSIGAKSKNSYEEVFEALVDPDAKSLFKFGKDTVSSTKANVAALSKAANVIGTVQEMSDAASYIGLVPGFQLAGAVLKAIAAATKAIQATLVGTAVAADAYGTYQIVEISETVLDKSGINERRSAKIFKREKATTYQDQPINLLASKNEYNNKITAFQAVAKAPVFNGNSYSTSLGDLMFADSVYQSETKNVFNQLIASSDSASLYIDGFKDRLRILRDSFYSRQMSYGNAFYFQQMALLMDLDHKEDYLPGFDSTSNEIKVLNDSAYNNIVRLINEINDNSIGSPAYLAQSDFSIIHDHTPLSTGSFTYTFKNYGKETMSNVSFKIDQPSEDFIITSSDLINVGNILPGEKKQITFNFVSPAAKDTFTIGKYAIDVSADNGKYSNVFGTLYIINRTALPVSLANYKIDCFGKQINLSWETLSESNSSHFEIERSVKGNNWLTIGSIEAAGNSNIVKEYKFADSPTENAFYRLKQVDKDGKFTYSLVEKSKCNVERTGVTVYPIPAQNILNIVTNVTKNSAVEIRIFDVAGREVKRSNSMLRAGYNTIQVNTNGLASGQYILRMEGTEISKTVKITIGK